MGCRITGQGTAMQCDPRPGKPLHMRHPGIVIEIGMMVRVLLNDTEDASGSLAPFLAARYRCPCNPPSGVGHPDADLARRCHCFGSRGEQDMAPSFRTSRNNQVV